MLRDTLANTNGDCKHSFVQSSALMNLATNGQTTDMERWEKGQGIYRGKRVRMVEVDKCIHCGRSFGLER